MNFGTTETETINPEGSTVSIIESIHKGEVTKTIKRFRVRVKVSGSQEEMGEYLDFTNNLEKLRQNKLLSPEAPYFMIEYPKHDEDGSYFVCKCWAEMVQSSA